MNWRECSRLDEVRQALAQGHWPDACAADLRAHVGECTHCANEVLISTHLQRARGEALAAARPGPSNLLWLKAQARRRNAALERIGRPLAAAQAFAFVVILAAIAGIVAVHWHSLTDRASSLTAALSGWGLAPIALGIGILTLLGCLAAYLTLERQ
jgi:anti-sigma factor RsiW